MSNIAIAGAGSIGCFVGGMLARGGQPVTLLARPRLISEIDLDGLRLTSFEGLDERVSRRQFGLTDNPDILTDARIIIVSVKSDDTRGVASLIAEYARPDAIVVSLQNGVGNVDVLRERLPGRTVLAGMVPFNVVSLGGGRFHRATSGDILIDADANNTAEKLSVPGLRIRAHANMAGIQWGKLLINLNNALNALSDVPLRDQLAQRNWRRLFADQMAEALTVMRAAGVHPVSTQPLPSSWAPAILRLPDNLFQLVAKQMLQIDPKARSSMWEDLSRGKRTEIDHLQGLIVSLGEKHDVPAPLSARVISLIRQAEAADKGPPGLTPEQIRL